MDGARRKPTDHGCRATKINVMTDGEWLIKDLRRNRVYCLLAGFKWIRPNTLRSCDLFLYQRLMRPEGLSWRNSLEFSQHQLQEVALRTGRKLYLHTETLAYRLGEPYGHVYAEHLRPRVCEGP